jgi:hypothetical protein
VLCGGHGAETDLPGRQTVTGKSALDIYSNRLARFSQGCQTLNKFCSAKGNFGKSPPKSFCY